MDTALKHRITGAVILVGLAVLLLPELFSGAGQPPSTTVGLEEDSAALREVEVDLRDDPAATAEVTPEVPIPVAAASTAEAESTVPLEADESSTDESSAEAGSADAAAPVAATAAAAVAATATAPATAPPRTSTPAPPAATPAATTGFFVQAGVFSNRQGADQVANSLRSKGFDVRITAAESAQPLHRVWVGPAKDRAAAEALLRRVRAAGHTGLVVSP